MSECDTSICFFLQNSRYFVILFGGMELIIYLRLQNHIILGTEMRQAGVYINKVYAGKLIEQGPTHYVFDYDDDYLESSEAKAVCCAMPLTCSHYESSHLFPFFSNLLSEGENRKFQSAVLKIDENDDFGILLATANYDTIGCVTVKPIEP